MSPWRETSTKRGSIGGTLSLANSCRPVLALRMRIARFSDRPEMYGKGWAGSTASGISTGNTWPWKYSDRRVRSSSSSWSHEMTSMPASASAGRTCDVHASA